mgnify:FL=1
MLINENTIKQLATAFEFDVFNEKQQVTIDNVTYEVDFKKKENKLEVTLVKIKEENKLRQFIDNLDDDLFQESCANIERLTGKTLKEWNTNSNSDEVYEMFKDVVETVLAEKRVVFEKQLNDIKSIYNFLFK